MGGGGKIMLFCMFFLIKPGVSPAQNGNGNTAVPEPLACGTYVRLIPPVPYPGEPTYYDRFGNEYTQTELQMGLYFGVSHCQNLPHFDLRFSGSFTTDEIERVCDVFTYLSSIISIPTGRRAVILIQKDRLGRETAALGTTYMPGDCGVGHSAIHRVLFTGAPNGIEDGSITINSDISYFYTGADASAIGASQVDFQSVILHEALHILGISSLLTPTSSLPSRFSLWDMNLRNVAGDFLIRAQPVTSGNCCATYDRNPVFSNWPDNIWTQNCGTNNIRFDVPQLPPVNAEYPNAPQDAETFRNVLSHLDRTCGSEHYVMHPYSNPGSSGVQRVLTNTEIAILCKLGYVTNGCTPDCIVVASDDYAGLTPPNTPVTIDVSLNDFPLNRPNTTFTLLPNCGNSQQLSITQTAPGSPIFTVSGATPGKYWFCYSISSCNGRYCDEGRVTVVITNPAISQVCQGASPCELNPLGNFESFSSVDEMLSILVPGGSILGNNNSFYFNNPTLQPPILFSGNGTSSWPSTVGCGGQNTIFQYQNSDNFVALSVFASQGQTKSQGVSFPLCKPIYPGMRGRITFSAGTFLQCTQNNIRIEFSEQPPVAGQNIHINPTTVGPVFDILVTSTQNSFYNTYTVEFNNQSTKCWNYLYLSAFVNAQNFTQLSTSVYIDDVSLVLQNRFNEVFAITDPTTSPAAPCLGEVVNIPFTICNNRKCGANGGVYTNPDIKVQAILPPGVTFIPSADFPTLATMIGSASLEGTNTCRTLTLKVRVDNNQTLVGQPLPIQFRLEAECYTPYTLATNITPIGSLATLSFQCAENSGTPNDCRICTGSNAPVTLTAFTNGNAYLWSTGATTQSITVSPTTTQSYTVTVTGPGICPKSDFISVEVMPDIAPLANFTFTTNCRTVTFVASQNLPNTTHTWDFGDGNGSSAANPVHTYATAGTFNVRHTVANACGAVTHTEIVAINSVPTVTLQVAENSGTANDGILCTGSGASATINAVASGVTYQWSIGATTSSITVSPTASTTYTVTVTASGGCTVTATTTITVQDCMPIPEGCTCPIGPTVYNLNNATNSALPSATITNACITITGTFTVTTPLSITNSTIIMQPGSEIVVDIPATTVASAFNLRNNTAIRGCGTMWKGIRVMRGRLILWDNMLIKDADYAVNIRGARAIVSIARNTFDKNYVAVYIPPLTDGPIRLAQSASVVNNKFLCSGPLATKHSNQSPVRDLWALAGALIYDQPGLIFSGSLTEFRGPRSGIIAQRSTLTVNSVTFKDLLDVRGSDPIYGFLHNTAIYGDGCQMVTVLNCKMENCRGGIRVNASGLRAENNPVIHITAPNNSNIALPFAISAARSSMRSIKISNNPDIRTTAYGIGVDLGDMEPTVTGNTILLLANAARAIDLSQCRTVNCNNNTISTQGGSIYDNRVAIRLSNIQNSDFIDNFIAGCDYGFFEGGGSMNRFIGNRVDATVIAGGTTPKRGFQISASSGEYFCDNTTNTSLVGFDFYGQCASGEFFRCSKIKNSSTGLRLNADNNPPPPYIPWHTVIGPQTHTSNKWTNTNAFHQSNNVNNILLSQFTMVDLLLPSWGTGHTPNPPWFMAGPFPMEEINCDDCGSTRDPDRLDAAPLVAGLAEKTAATGGYENSVTNWIAGQQLYKRLYNQPTNIEKAAEFAAFMAEHQPGLMGTMHTIQQQMYRQSAIWTTPRNKLQELTRELTKRLEEALLLQEAEADELTIQLKLADATWYATQAEQVIAPITATFEASVPGLLAQNAALPTPNAAVSHEKALHHLLLSNGYWNWSPQQTLPETSIASLKSLADECPFTHGLSVYEARAWYAFLHPEANWSPTEGCEYGERGAIDRSKTSESIQVSVLPNPAKDHLTVQLQAPAAIGCQFELFDLAGKCWRAQTFTPGDQVMEVFTHDMPEGLYLYWVKTAKGVPQSGKIVIIH